MTVKNVLRRWKVPPTPGRAQQGHRSKTFAQGAPDHYIGQILACACFTVETVWLKTCSVLFFSELGARRVHLADCTAHPTAAWVAGYPLGVPRQISWDLQDRAQPPCFLIHDRDAKVPAAFDMVFAAEGVTILRTPYQAAKANACAVRWIRSVREACLDHLLIFNEQHLQRVLTEYVVYFNHARPGYPLMKV